MILKTGSLFLAKFFIFSLFTCPLFASAQDTIQSILDSEKRITALRNQISEKLGLSSTGVCSGRLTLATATPVTVTDQTAKSTLYFTPFRGAKIALYDGSKWVLKTFSEVSLALSGLTSDKNYDVFGYDNSGLTLELSAVWTNDTTRADALTTIDGILVKNGATTRRYLGTIRTTSTTTTEDSTSKRFVWNVCHPRPRTLRVADSTNSWTYAGSALQPANNSTANKAEYVVGSASVLVYARALSIALGLAAMQSGVGVDSTTVDSSQLHGGKSQETPYMQIWADYRGYPGLGYHYLQWLEASDGTNTQTFIGDNGGTNYQSGLVAWIEG